MTRSRKVGTDFPSRHTASQATGFNVHVSVGRETHSRAAGAYYACAQVQKTGRRRRSNAGGSACAYGSAPRRAAAKALAALGKQLVKRSSAFRGA